MAEVKEACGVVGAVSEGENVTRNLWLGLLALQHRGQEAFGIYTFDKTRFYHRKQLGLIDSAEAFDGLKGNLGIGHVRYSTVGQPANAVHLKLNVVRAVVAGKNVLLVDDSIVRGTTMKKIVTLLREAGANRVDVWVTCPPVKSACFYGIDMATHSELIASLRTVEEIRRAVGADGLCYQTVDGLLEAIGLPKRETCLACLTGVYPTPLAQKIADEMWVKPGNQNVEY